MKGGFRTASLVAALVAAACSSNAEPATTSASSTGSTSPSATTTSTTLAPITATLYFPNPGLAGDDPCGAVFPVERMLPEADGDDPFGPALRALLVGPNPEEQAAGFEPLVGPAVTAHLDASDSGTLIVDFGDLLGADASLAGVCPGRALSRAIEATFGGDRPVEFRLDGDRAAFEDRVGVRCPLEPARPGPGMVLVYFDCAPDEPPVPLARPATGSSASELLQAALAAQVAGPTPDERAAGASSASAADLLVLDSAAIEGSTATVDFNGADTGSLATGDDGARLIRGLLPVVFQFPEVETASLTVDGRCLEDPCRTLTRDDARRALLSGRDRRAATRMLDDLAVLTAGGPREAGTLAERAAGDYLAGLLEATGAGVVVDDVPLPGVAATRNVSATYGDGPLHVLVGAHYDSVRVSPGADDNGSGVVVLLELTRRFAEQVPAGLTVTVAFFGAEEILSGAGGDSHHFGSRAMATALAEAGALPDRMVSVDMVGLGERLLAVTYLDTDNTVATDLVAAGTEVGVSITPVAKGDISDHEAFARAGVPAAFLWRPDNPAWHTPGDDTVDDLALLEDLWVVEQYLADLAS